MGEQGGDKTEEPTPHRLREAREKGQIAKSKEITTAVLVLVSYMFLNYYAMNMWREMVGSTQQILQLIPEARNFSISFAGSLLMIAMKGITAVCLPIFILTVVFSLVAESLQTGFVFAGEPLSPKLERINPIEGFKKMFSMQGFVELIKSIIKIIIVFYIAWVAIKEDLPFIIILMDSAPWDVLALGASIAYKIAIRVGIFYIVIAILDYLYKRWEFTRNLRMTRQEVKEEYKRLEGDPMVKQRMRDMQRQVAYQRMMAQVPQADVVVTNPTHVAVALKYTPKKMRAPLVLAKGERVIAEEIKRIAETYNVPIVENEPLARSVHRTTKVGREVPPELYQAVAETLAFVYKLKRDRKQRLEQSLGPLQGVSRRKS
jgi:flagellar biosynthetic protein FlhB